MPRMKSIYACQQCGALHQKWSGRCDSCGEWNSLVEQINESQGKSVLARAARGGTLLRPQTFQSIASDSHSERLRTEIKELDAVLGGGIVAGSVVLLAGQPGIGKSTLLLQVANSISMTHPVLYVSGEESASQVRMRAARLGADTVDQLAFVSSTRADDIAATIHTGAYSLVIVDSVQTISIDDIASAPGTVSQITNSSNIIIRAAKESGASVLLVGHVTKEGSIAGPKVLEHLVDVVLQFEGDRYGGYKIVKAMKNRFGSTSESAIFEMFDKGLRIIENPSAALLAERNNADGSVVLATMEGSQPLLVEIQALVNATNFGYPKRTASGFDLNRLNVLIAVLERRTKLNLSDKDIYVNVVGGLKLSDPAADLAVCMAIASAAAERKMDDGLVVFGEVGLGGEVRSAHGVDKRVEEAKRLGFTKAIGPATAARNSFVRGITELRQGLIEYLQK